jgi:chromosome segregation ATPase
MTSKIQLQKEVNALKFDIACKAEEIGSLEKSLEGVMKQSASLNSAVLHFLHLSNEENKNRKVCTSSSKVIESLQAQIETLKSQSEAFQKMAHKERQAKYALQEDLLNADKELKYLKANKNYNDSQIERRERIISEERNTHRQLNLDLDSARAEITTYKEQIDVLSRENSALCERSQKAEERRWLSDSQYRLLEESFKEMKLRTSESIESTRSQVQEVRDRIQTNQYALGALEKKAEQIFQRSSLYKEELTRTQAGLSCCHQVWLSLLEELVKQATHEISFCHIQQDALSHDITSLGREIGKLSHRLQIYGSHLDEPERRLETIPQQKGSQQL